MGARRMADAGRKGQKGHDGKAPRGPLGCVDGFTVVDWREFLLRTNDVPAELLEKCPWDKFTGFDWAGLLFGKKKLGRYCPWETFDKDDWRILLFFHPEYRKEFEVHSGLKDEDLHVEDPGPIGWL